MTDESPRAGRSGGVLRALTSPALRRLLGAYAVSRIGDLLYNTALVAIVLQRTGSASWVAATIVAQVSPGALFTPFAGVLADRMDRRRLMVLTDLGRSAAMVLATITVAADAPVVLLIAVAFLSSTIGTPFGSAFVALMPEVVAEDELAAANAVITGTSYAAIVVGPAFAALALLGGLDPLPFAVNALTFLASAAFISGLRPARAASPGQEAPTAEAGDDEPPATPAEPFWSAFATGLRVLVVVPVLRVATGLSMLLMFLYGVQLVLLPLVSRDLLGTGEAGLGWLNACMGIGGVLAVGLGARLAGGSTLALSLVGSGVVFCLAQFFVGTTSAALVAYAVLIVQGAAALVQEVSGMTAMQRGAAPDQIARVDGIAASLAFGSLVLGNLAAPALVSAFGLRETLIGAGLFGAVASALVLLDPGSRPPAPAAPEVVTLLRGLPELAGLETSAVEALAAAADAPQPVPAGTRLLEAGERAREVLVLVSGSCDVLTADGTPITTVSGPDLLGEIGVLQARPRTASVVTTSECVVHRIPGEALRRALVPGARSALDSTISARLARWPG